MNVWKKGRKTSVGKERKEMCEKKERNSQISQVSKENVYFSGVGINGETSIHGYSKKTI